MSLHDVIKAKLDTPKLCKLGVLLTTLDPNDADALNYAISAVKDDRLSIAWLVRALNGSGYSIGKTVVSDHVRETCACG